MSQTPIDVSALKSSDFELRPYMKSSNLIATWQVLTVVVPLAALWYAAWLVHAPMPWLLVPIVLVMVMFLLRSFALMHDCGHYSLFHGKRLNRAVGFCFGIINGLPQYPWSRGHDFHHQHNGNWERYRGPAAVISVEQFRALSPWRRRLYAWLRHPVMLLPGGFFYLVVKPRVQLLCGLIDLIPRTLRLIAQGKWRQIGRFESRFWYTTGEFWDILANNICVIASWWIAGELMGHGLFWAIYAPLMTLAAAVFICVFYIQHNYDDSYAHKSEGWSYISGALEGSSFFQLPPVLNWFTADIGYHNVHHLCARIPNYRLAACHRANAHLLSAVKILRIKDIPACYGYILWDAEHDCLITIKDFRQRQQQGVAKPSLAVLNS